jgi:hypothetical protein
VDFFIRLAVGRSGDSKSNRKKKQGFHVRLF